MGDNWRFLQVAAATAGFLPDFAFEEAVFDEALFVADFFFVAVVVACGNASDPARKVKKRNNGKQCFMSKKKGALLPPPVHSMRFDSYY